MGIRRTVAEFSQEAGSDIADFLTDRARDTRDFACDLWSKYPDRITGNNALIGSFGRGFMNSLCADIALPPPLVPPTFQGGQCPGVSYEVDYRVITYNFEDCTQTNNFVTTLIQDGPISEPEIDVIANFGGETNCHVPSPQPISLIAFNTVTGSDRIDSPGGQQIVDRNMIANPPLHNVFIEAIRRRDGLPDDCGDAGNVFPPTNIDPADLTTNIIIEQPDNLTLQIPITINEGDLSFPMNFSVGGISTTLDLGGIEFNFGERNTLNEPANLPDGQAHPLPTPIDDSIRSFPCPPSSLPALDDLESEELDPSDGVECDEIEGLIAASLDIPNLPTNIKTQSGNGAPNVIYLGWFEFRNGDRNYPRQPIHFQRNFYLAPVGATGFAYTLYNGVEGIATKFSQ